MPQMLAYCRRNRLHLHKPRTSSHLYIYVYIYKKNDVRDYHLFLPMTGDHILYSLSVAVGKFRD